MLTMHAERNPQGADGTGGNPLLTASPSLVAVRRYGVDASRGRVLYAGEELIPAAELSGRMYSEKKYEQVVVVDLHGNPLTIASRLAADRYNLRLDTSRVLVWDECGRIWVQRRASNPSVLNGSKLEAGVGETAAPLELHWQTSMRGIEEEMFHKRATPPIGIDDLVNLGTFAWTGKTTSRNYAVHGWVYRKESQGRIALDPNETQSGKFYTLKELKAAAAQKEDFTPVGWIMARYALHLGRPDSKRIPELGLLRSWAREVNGTIDALNATDM